MRAHHQTQQRRERGRRASARRARERACELTIRHSSSPDVIVVGVGLAGLRAAQLLCRRGLDVTVLDAADRPGGRMATDVVDGFRCDRGFQVLNTAYPALRAAADLAALDLRAFEPGAAIRGARRPSQDLAAAGLEGPVVERFLRPFLSGVLGESTLSTSAAFVRLVWRRFALGTVVVPADGMGALPAQLAAGLPGSWSSVSG